MAKEKQSTTDHAEISIEAATAPVYVGPQPAPLISNVPGMIGSHHADEITDRQQIAFIQVTVPAAAKWWKWPPEQ